MEIRSKRSNCIDFLPPDVFTEIFTRLSVKTLLDLTLVCKAWKAIIYDQRFIQHHLQVNKNNNKYLLTRERRRQAMLNVRRSDTLDFVVKSLHRDNKFGNTTLCPIVAHIDGVLLTHISEHKFNEGNNLIFLWNPTIPRIVSIPAYFNLKKSRDVNFGFGFDGTDNTYKVVAVNLEHFSTKTKVYSLRTRQWTLPKAKRCEITPVLHLKYPSKTTNFDGGIYWLASAEKRRNCFWPTQLLRFDMSSESFTSNPLPPYYDKEYVYSSKIEQSRSTSILNDSLALLDVYDKNESICAMNARDGTWIKLHDLKIDYDGTFLHLKSDAKLYVRRLYEDRFSVIDLETRQDRMIQRRNAYYDIKFMDVYKESLVLLGESNYYDSVTTEKMRSLIQNLPSGSNL